MREFARNIPVSRCTIFPDFTIGHVQYGVKYGGNIWGRSQAELWGRVWGKVWDKVTIDHCTLFILYECIVCFSYNMYMLRIQTFLSF